MTNKQLINIIRKKLKELPTTEEIKKAEINIKMANSYYQGKFDILLDLLRILKKEK